MDAKGLLRTYFRLLKNSVRLLKQINELNKNLAPDKSYPIIRTTLYELEEQSDRIKLRQEVANTECYSLYRNRALSTVTSNNEILEGFIESDKLLVGDDKVEAIKFLIESERGAEFVEEKVDAMIRYYKARKDCAFPEIAKFMDEHLAEFYNTECVLRGLSTVFNGYKKENLNTPFNIIERKRIKQSINIIENEDIYNKSRESLRRLVNASILSTRDEVYQIEGNDKSKDKDERMLRKIVRTESI